MGQEAVLWICIKGECESIRPDRGTVNGDWFGGSVAGLAQAHRGGISTWLSRQYIFVDRVVGV